MRGSPCYSEVFGPGSGAFLTDTVNDPHELINLVTDPTHAALVTEMSVLARAHAAGKTEPTPISWPNTTP